MAALGDRAIGTTSALSQINELLQLSRNTTGPRFTADRPRSEDPVPGALHGRSITVYWGSRTACARGDAQKKREAEQMAAALLLEDPVVMEAARELFRRRDARRAAVGEISSWVAFGKTLVRPENVGLDVSWLERLGSNVGLDTEGFEQHVRFGAPAILQVTDGVCAVIVDVPGNEEAIRTFLKSRGIVAVFDGAEELQRLGLEDDDVTTVDLQSFYQADFPHRADKVSLKEVASKVYDEQFNKADSHFLGPRDVWSTAKIDDDHKWYALTDALVTYDLWRRTQ